MENVKMIGEYTVLDSMYIGHREIAIGENQKAAVEERYMCCYIESVAVFERYTEAVASDDFAEIVKVYGERIASAAEEVIKETEVANERVGANLEIKAAECTPIKAEDSLEGKVVVIKGDHLRPEFRHASRQLLLCIGGFGSKPNAKGRTCYCRSLYDGKQTSYYRSDILGVIEPEELPEWAKEGLKKAKELPIE